MAKKEGGNNPAAGTKRRRKSMTGESRDKIRESLMSKPKKVRSEEPVGSQDHHDDNVQDIGDEVAERVKRSAIDLDSGSGGSGSGAASASGGSEVDVNGDETDISMLNAKQELEQRILLEETAFPMLLLLPELSSSG
jgi:hypothetical protein